MRFLRSLYAQSPRPGTTDVRKNSRIGKGNAWTSTPLPPIAALDVLAMKHQRRGRGCHHYGQRPFLPQTCLTDAFRADHWMTGLKRHQARHGRWRSEHSIGLPHVLLVWPLRRAASQQISLLRFRVRFPPMKTGEALRPILASQPTLGGPDCREGRW